MKKNVPIIGFVIGVVLLTTLSTSIAGDFNNTFKGTIYVTYGQFNPPTASLPTNVASIQNMFLITNHGDRSLKLGYTFYDNSGQVVGTYDDSSEIPAHGAKVVMINDLMRYSTNQFCSIDINWQSRGDVKPQVVLQSFMFTSDEQLVAAVDVILSNPNY